MHRLMIAGCGLAMVVAFTALTPIVAAEGLIPPGTIPTVEPPIDRCPSERPLGINMTNDPAKVYHCYGLLVWDNVCPLFPNKSRYGQNLNLCTLL